MSLRICMIAACPFPARRGTPLRIERLAETLVERGHEVEVVTYDVAEAPWLSRVAVVRSWGREAYRRMAPGPNLQKLLLLDPLLARKLRGRLSTHAYDLIHAHHFEGVIVAKLAARGLGLPIVYDAHTMLAAELPTYFSKPLRPLMERIGRALDGRLPALADHVCTVTPDIAERLVGAHRFDPRTVTVVPNGIEVEPFAACTPGGGTGHRLIYTGTLASYQGVGELMQAFALLLQTRPALELRLSVSSPSERVMKYARALGVAHAVEILDDDFDLLPERLADAGIAVLPRQACDGIPHKLLNYMAAGKPTVAFAGSAKVLHHEETGLVVPNGDIAGFAAAILRLVDDPDLRRRLGTAARSHVLTHHTWPAAAQLAERAYERLLSARRSALIRPDPMPRKQRDDSQGSRGAPQRPV